MVDEVANPTPGKNQVELDVKAAAVNFPDTLIIQNLYQFKPEQPLSADAELGTIFYIYEDQDLDEKSGVH